MMAVLVWTLFGQKHTWIVQCIFSKVNHYCDTKISLFPFLSQFLSMPIKIVSDTWKVSLFNIGFLPILVIWVVII